MYLLFQNHAEMVQQIRVDFLKLVDKSRFDIEKIVNAQFGSLQITATENGDTHDEALDFNFNDPSAGAGSWNMPTEKEDGCEYNIHISNGEALHHRANCKIDYTIQDDGAFKVDAESVAVICENMIGKLHRFFKFAANRMQNITDLDIIEYEKGGWTAGYDKDGCWHLSKVANGEKYVLYPDYSNNRFDPPCTSHPWMASFPDSTTDDGRNAVGIVMLEKAKTVLEWHIALNSKTK